MLHVRVVFTPVHEVSRGDDVDVGIVRLEDELEAAPDLLLAHGADGHDLLERARNALLPGGGGE